ncbi:hypothetical protein ACFPFV_01500 [Salinicoccus siamensis]|uniref:Transposase-like zinc ribbon protein n=1 Tax=Salinicoccus siamensis TaxID=381830 RepID=A0ABV5Z8X1_9STAP
MTVRMVHFNFKRGIKCPFCHSFDWQTIGSNFGRCDACGKVVGIQAITAEYFNRLHMISPDIHYKRRDIIDHLKLELSEYTLQKIIRQNFIKLEGHTRIYRFSPCTRLWPAINAASLVK